MYVWMAAAVVKMGGYDIFDLEFYLWLISGNILLVIYQKGLS
jgi:hypothetical protein